MQIVKPDAITTTGSITRSGIATYYDSDGYLKTSTAGALRFGYNPRTLEFVGVILEDASTNLLLQSEAFDNASWSKTNIVAITANTHVAPTNTSIAEKIIPDATLGQHSIYQQITASALSGQTHTFSIYVKSEGYRWIKLKFDGTAGGAFYAYFDALTGTVGTTAGLSVAPDVESLKNGWFRISITKTLTSNGTLVAAISVYESDNQSSDWSGNTTSGVVLYGAQAELKSKMTSYIPTTTTTASRAAEVITGDGVLYTSVTNPYSEWSSATTYSIGQVVVVGTYTGSNTVTIANSGTYKSLTNSNTNNNPLTSPSNWVRIGPTNQFAMFDNIVSSSTSSTTEFTFVIKSIAVDTIAVLNAIADKLAVAVSDYSYSQQYIGNVAYNRTLQLSGAESLDWFSYFFFESETQKTQGIFVDIPQVTSGVITVRVVGTGTVSAGSFVNGQVREIGGTQYGVNTGIIDYSKKTVDEFGNTTLIVRNYSKRMNAKVFLSNTNLNRVQRLLYSIRATPVLWIASDDPELEEPLVILGYYKDFDTEIAYPNNSLCNLSVEGLI